MSDHVNDPPTPEDQAAAELRDLWPRGLCAHELAIAFGRHAADAIRLRAEVARLTAERDEARDACRYALNAIEFLDPSYGDEAMGFVRRVARLAKGGHP